MRIWPLKTIKFYSETKFDTNKPESEAGTGQLPLKKTLYDLIKKINTMYTYIRFLPVDNERLRKKINTGNVVIPA